MDKKKLSIILVNYNCGNFLVKCLKSLDKIAGIVDLDIWIVDNNSQDDSIKLAKSKYPGINYILNSDNKGFSAANNQALRKINNEFILLLNPDTEVPAETLPFMLDFMESHPEAGAATCKGLKSDGKMDWGYHRGFPTPWASFLYFLGNDRFYHLTDRDMEKVHEVDAVSGSFFMTKKSILDQVGMLDEDYWLYGEDLDLCFRIKKAWYKIYYVPDVSVTHLKGISSGIKEHSQELTSATIESRIRAFNSFYETMKIFYHKNLAPDYPFFINWMIDLAINLKWFLAKRKLQV